LFDPIKVLMNTSINAWVIRRCATIAVRNYPIDCPRTTSLAYEGATTVPLASVGNLTLRISSARAEHGVLDGVAIAGLLAIRITHCGDFCFLKDFWGLASGLQLAKTCYPAF